MGRFWKTSNSQSPHQRRRIVNHSPVRRSWKVVPGATIPGHGLSKGIGTELDSASWPLHRSILDDGCTSKSDISSSASQSSRFLKMNQASLKQHTQGKVPKKKGTGFLRALKTAGRMLLSGCCWTSSISGPMSNAGTKGSGHREPGSPTLRESMAGPQAQQDNLWSPVKDRSDCECVGFPRARMPATSFPETKAKVLEPGRCDLEADGPSPSVCPGAGGNGVISTCYYRLEIGADIAPWGAHECHGTGHEGNQSTLRDAAVASHAPNIIDSIHTVDEKADEYWQWDEEQHCYRHWDEEQNEWIICPEDFD